MQLSNMLTQTTSTIFEKWCAFDPFSAVFEVLPCASKSVHFFYLLFGGRKLNGESWNTLTNEPRGKAKDLILGSNKSTDFPTGKNQTNKQTNKKAFKISQIFYLAKKETLIWGICKWEIYYILLLQMIKTYFIRNTMSKLLIYSVHSLGFLERPSDENQMILEVREVLGSSDPAL